MKAMILAAGLGTRLRPLTDHRPKALVEIAGQTLLQIALARLRSFGVRDVIINVHHFADMVLEYLRAHDNFGMHLEISREDVLLDTGGGLKQAAWFFSNDSDEPFILHNVDVISAIDLERMVQFHRRQQALATLAAQDRKTSRYLLFDEEGQLCGRRSIATSPAHPAGKTEWVRPSPNAQPLAFAGIHIISPRLLPKLTEAGVFSIIDAYLRLSAQAEEIVAFRSDEYYWRDLGRPEQLQQAAEDLQQGKWSL